jgi:hypothetical protein
MNSRLNERLLVDPRALRARIQEKVGAAGLHDGLADLSPRELKRDSVVLFVLSDCPAGQGSAEPCLILNKRSPRVRQGGDLCCPGGGLSWGTDRLLAPLLRLPGSPLRRWSQWSRWRGQNSRRGRALAVLLAAGLREAWEEMRLNPLGVSFLGVLPEQHLVMFDRVIYPLVGWAPAQRLKPNWEVARIVTIPLRKLLDPGHYGRFRPMVTPADDDHARQLRIDDFPCFIHQDAHGREMLWGATYRITQSFLERVFDFSPPAMDNLPLAHRHLDGAYLNGSRWNARAARSKGPTDW